MKNLLYLMSVIAIIGWVIGFVGYKMGGRFHLLLVVAIIFALVGIFRGERP